MQVARMPRLPPLAIVRVHADLGERSGRQRARAFPIPAAQESLGQCRSRAMSNVAQARRRKGGGGN
jgi:hypothetical protein